jgi:hypothetical protein
MHPTELPGTVVRFQDTVSAAGGFPLALAEWKELAWQETSGLGKSTNRGYARLVISADSQAINYARVMRVVRIDDPQNFGAATDWKTWEFRITEIDDSAQAPDVVLTCAPIIEDLGRTTLRAVNGGVPTKSVSFTGTVQQFIETLILPALAAEGITHFSLGTIEPTITLTYTGRNVTCLALLTWLEQQTSTDAWCSRPSESTFAINVTRRGSSDPTPLAFVGRNCVALDRTIIVDERFATRVEPEGRTLNDETEPTNIGQATLLAESESSRVITVADPSGGDDLIGADDELNGKRAFYALDPLHFSNVRQPLIGSTIGASGGTIGAAHAIAIDSTRRIMWGFHHCDKDIVWWRSLTDDASAGEVNLGSSITYVKGIGYDPTNDRIVCVAGDVAKVVLINASTRAIAGTVTMAHAPDALCGIANGKAFVGYAYGDTTNIDVVDTSGAGSITTNLANTSGWDTRYTKVVYHTGSTRYFAVNDGLTNPAAINWYNSSLVYVSTTAGAVDLNATAISEPGATNIIAISSEKFHSINPSTGVVTTTTLPTWPPTLYSTGRIFQAYHWHNRYYIVSFGIIAAYDGVDWLMPVADAGRPPGILYFAIATEPPPSSNENGVIYTADVGCIRRTVATKDQDLLSPFEAFTIVDTDATNQRITAPASGSGGPVDIQTEADGAGQGALIEVRENAALDYRTQLIDPTALAAYGAIDVAPQYDVVAKRNYWRGSTFRSDTWRADDTARWASLIWDGPESLGAIASHWKQADATGFAFWPLTLTATWNNSTTTPDLTLSVSGLNSGTVLSPGDYIGLDPGPRINTLYCWFVRQRTVADGSGNATIPVVPMINGLSNVASGTTVYLSSPSMALPDSRTDCAVIYSLRHKSVASVVPTFPRFSFECPVPKIVGDSRAWAYVHVRLASYFFNPIKFQLKVWTPYVNSYYIEGGAGNWPNVITPEDDVSLRDGSLRDYWLAQPLDLGNTPTHGFVRCELTLNEDSGYAFAAYIVSAGVVLQANSPDPIGVYGAEGPNTLLQLGRSRLVAGNAPSINYRLRVLEDNPAKPFTVGVAPDLRDPTRGISLQPPNGPRVISLTRRGKVPGEVISQPEIELGATPLDVFVANLVQQLTAPTTTSASPVGAIGGSVSMTGGVGSPPPVNYLPVFAHNAIEDWYDSGISNGSSEWAVQSSGGRGGTKPCIQTISNAASYGHLINVFTASKLGVGHLWDLNSATLPGQYVLLYTFWSDQYAHVSIAIESSTRKIVALLWDYSNAPFIGPGYNYVPVVLKTSTAVLPSTGRFHLYAHMASSTSGYVKVWLDGVQILNFNGDTFGSFAGSTGTSSNIYKVDILRSTLFNIADTINSANFYSPIGLRLAEGQVFDTSAIVSPDDWPGQVYTDNLRPTANSATYTSGTANGAAQKWDCIDDPPQTSYPSNLQTYWATDYIEMAADGDRYTAAFQDLSGSRIFGVSPKYVARHSQSSGAKAVKVSCFSGGTLGESSYQATVGNFYARLLGPSSTEIFFNTDPNTAAAWDTNVSAFNAAEWGFKQEAAAAGNNAAANVRMSAILLTVSYRP